MAALADRPFTGLLDEVAAERPAPGGGAAAAWTCALAAALVEMACAFAGHDGERERAAGLRAGALEQAERDLEAYAPVLEALRRDREDPGREARVRDALSDAAESPLAMAEAGAAIAAAAAAIARAGRPHLRGDALAAALLAEGATRAAAALVEVNLAGQASDPRRARVAELAERAAAAARDARG